MSNLCEFYYLDMFKFYTKFNLRLWPSNHNFNDKIYVAQNKLYSATHKVTEY